MKRITILLTTALIALIALPTSAQVKPGIEVLRDSEFSALQGKRVGLITNPTGVDSQLQATADILAQAENVELVAFFAPEHGIRGDILAGNKVATTVDEATGIKVHSIYGKIKAPTSQMLSGIDALVYDIQDNGCRSYTYISTMGKAMEAAAKAGIELIVLDRPNPLGGNRVEGPLVDSDCISFVSQYPIPYLYGLTPGELALYLKGEGLIAGADSLKLTIVPMEGWSRNMTYEQTGLPWVLPSPHIPYPSTCTYYAATGIIGELSWLSIGVGYTLPFKTFAAPWIDGAKLADTLNAGSIAGVTFRPIYYTPFYGAHKGTPVEGVEVYVTDSEKAQLTMIQFHVLEAIHKLYPKQNPLTPTDNNRSRLRMFDQVVGSKAIRSRLVSNDYKVDSILTLWNRDVESFTTTKQKYHLYQ